MRLTRIMFACATTMLPALCAASAVQADSPQQPAPAAPQAVAKKPKPEWGREVEGFRMSIMTAAKTLAWGDAVDLDVVCEDVNREAVDITEQGIVFTYRLEILRPDGSLAPLTAEGEKTKLGAIRSTDIGGGIWRPGSRKEFSLRANADFDMTQLGEYQLRVSRSVPKRPENMKDENDKEATLYSNVIKIRIEAAKK